jgi:hypothetical protein
LALNPRSYSLSLYYRPVVVVIGRAVPTTPTVEEALETMKLALDVWHDLWENAERNGGCDPDRHPDEENRYYPWSEDYLAWVRDTKPRGEYQASLRQT